MHKYAIMYSYILSKYAVLKASVCFLPKWLLHSTFFISFCLDCYFKFRKFWRVQVNQTDSRIYQNKFWLPQEEPY